MSDSCDLPALIERWFTDRLMRHRGASANTIAFNVWTAKR
ncbi:hypothetical protein ACVWZV_009164 [Bradyrhizobium sp. GM5.1]